MNCLNLILLYFIGNWVHIGIHDKAKQNWFTIKVLIFTLFAESNLTDSALFFYYDFETSQSYSFEYYIWWKGKSSVLGGCTSSTSNSALAVRSRPAACVVPGKKYISNVLYAKVIDVFITLYILLSSNVISHKRVTYLSKWYT